MIFTGVVTNVSEDEESFESCLDLNKLKGRKKHPRRKKLDLDKVQMNFRCGWEECDYESTQIKDYLSHVSEHVNNLWTEEWQSNEKSMYITVFCTIFLSKCFCKFLEWFTCLWKNCTFQSKCEVKSTTHVNFHAYHSRLKCVGQAVLDLCEIPVRTL